MVINFEFETKYGKYSDAIFIDAPMSNEEIEKEKQRRLANWISVIEGASSNQTLPEG